MRSGLFQGLMLWLCLAAAWTTSTPTDQSRWWSDCMTTRQDQLVALTIKIFGNINALECLLLREASSFFSKKEVNSAQGSLGRSLACGCWLGA